MPIRAPRPVSRLRVTAASASAAGLAALVFAALAFAVLMAPTGASAQGAPPFPGMGGSPGGNPMCQRLEAQLAALDRGGGGGSERAEQIRRLEDTAARQQGELDRVTQQARRMGCESSGLFAIFGSQSSQCGPINSQIQQLRANIDQTMSGLSRLRGSGNFEQDSQRRSVLAALAQNNCGPQYGSVRPAQPGGFLDNIFGNNSSGPDGFGGGNTFRTVCVRTCDGYFFPISFATSQSRFADDERTCKKLCPAAEAVLYTHRNPGEDMNNAVSLSGHPYAQMPNAFKYRTAYDAACSCKPQGQSWAEALKNTEDHTTLEHGDIVVTEERAKQLSLPRDQQGRPVRQTSGAKGATATPQAAVSPTPAAAAGETATTPPADPNRPIRSVGPTFIPQR